MPILHNIRLFFTCLSIAANALFAGGIFTFPLLAPALALQLKLTQPQLTTIALLGMMGQYPFAAVVGKVIDEYGPWACSLTASFLFAAGFGVFATEIAKTPDDIIAPSNTSFRVLAACFFILGLGTVSSYFSSLFAASRAFPQHLGAASGASLALFGLSPLFLSVLASRYFTSPSTGLDVTRFLFFLALTSGIVHLAGAFNLKFSESQCQAASTSESAPSTVASSDDGECSNECQPLLANEVLQSNVQVVSINEGGSVLHLFRDRHFWLLALISLIILGSCEMVISNIGTIVLSLRPKSAPSTRVLSPAVETATVTQVRLISISNTLSRLLSGPLVDLISPVTHMPANRPQRRHISRVVLLSWVPLLLAGTYVYQELFVRTLDDLWILSVATGAAYGTTFTILPSIVSSIWGSRDFGRNFGILTYAPFLGTPIFSYLYAFVSAHNNVDGGVCTGITCWSLTFWVCTGTSLLSYGGSILLWQRWKGLV